ncbi:MAG: MMPL family transporter [Patescibacteria group bacterium]
MLYGNLYVKKAGDLDDALLNKQDPYRLLDERVKGLASQGLKTGDAISFVVQFPKAITKEDMEYVSWFTETLEKSFPGFGILSLSKAAHYQDTGDALSSDPYISQKLLDDPRFDIERWKADVRRDSGVYGLLIGKEFDYSQIILLLPVGYEEMKTFRNVANMLEQREIPEWEWFFKSDIKPTGRFERVMPAGWVIGRGLIFSSLTADVMRLSTIGLGLVCLIAWVSLRSLRQAVIATLVVLICFIWARGSIGLAQIAGLPVYERVYFLLVDTAIIVAGISFAVHKFCAYNENRLADNQATMAAVWRRSRSINGVIGVTALIAILNFLTLYQIGVRGIMEVGIFASLGIAYLILLSLLFLPALHSLVGGEAVSVKNSLSRIAWAAAIWDRFLCGIVRLITAVIGRNKKGRFAYRKIGWLSLSLVGALVVATIGMISLDYIPGVSKDFDFIEVRTRPLEYIPGTIVYRASKFLNENDRYGFDRVSVLVMPSRATTVDDPAFIQKAVEFQNAIARLANVREVKSALDTVGVVSRESYGVKWPTTTQQAHDIWEIISWDVGPPVQQQLWFDQGVVIFASTAMEDSNVLGQLCDEIRELGEQFPGLQILPFGKVPIYPRNDKYIREGKPLNLLTSQWIVAIICGLWIFWRNRGIRGGTTCLSSWRTGLVMNVPFIFATAVIAVLMMVLRIPLDQATACVTAMAINAAMDFGLYLVAAYQPIIQTTGRLEALRGSMRDKGRAVLVDITLNCFCFLPLTASNFIPVARLGWVMIAMLIACGFGAMVAMLAALPLCVVGREKK